jgi:hypothetical protein
MNEIARLFVFRLPSSHMAVDKEDNQSITMRRDSRFCRDRNAQKRPTLLVFFLAELPFPL